MGILIVVLFILISLIVVFGFACAIGSLTNRVIEHLYALTPRELQEQRKIEALLRQDRSSR